jgi:hypothetical protein
VAAVVNLRRLAIFALLSLIAHLIIVSDISLPVLRQADDPPPLRVRLQAAPALPPLLPRPLKPAVQAATPSLPEFATAPTSTAPETWPATNTESAAPVITEAPAPAPAPAPTPAAAPVVENKPALARRLPRNGEITYLLYYGNNRFNVGRTMQSWSISGGRYRVTSASETTGIAALISRQSIEYVSSGRLTASGLQPDSFSNERQRSGKKDAATARFDWSAQTITFGEPPRSAPLAGNAQDLISFMYQLGLVPLSPGRIELPITNGWKFERYELEIGVEEPLQTPFGDLRAVPVRQVRRANEESIELWLAPAYRWLPVRIRFFDRDGEPSGEQIVSDIKVSEE